MYQTRVKIEQDFLTSQNIDVKESKDIAEYTFSNY